MRLNKRLYLLTPLLVLCCVILAGAYSIQKDKVKAENDYPWVDEYKVYEYFEYSDSDYNIYNAATMEDFLKENNSDYEIRTLDAYLFDYNGDAWNKYWTETFASKEKHFAFVGGGCLSDYYSASNSSNNMNQGRSHILEIVDKKLGISNNSPIFKQEPYTGDQGAMVGAMLFDPKYNANDEISDFRTTYDTSFQFIYDPDTQVYKYNSGTNHAQLDIKGDINGDNIEEGNIVQYADAVSPGNRIQSQNEVFVLGNDYYSFECSKGVLAEYKYGDANTNTSSTDGDEDGDGYKDRTYFNITWDQGVEFKLNFDQFIAPESSSANWEWASTIQSKNVEFLYFDVAISVHDRTEYAVDSNPIRIIINDDLENEKIFYINYKYTGGNTGANRMQLRIPMVDIVGDDNGDGIANDITIESITFSPIHSGSTLFGSGVTTTKTIDFNVWDFGIIYRYNNDGTEFSDGYDKGNFLPFVDISKTKAGYYEREANVSYGDGYNGWNDFEKWNASFNNNLTVRANRAMLHSANSGLREINPYSLGKDEDYGSAAHFGMTMEADFYLPEGGMLGEEPIKFTFKGDDDLWVFIDGVLVLDVGGIHSQVNGEINFATGEVTYANGTSYNAPNYSAEVTDIDYNLQDEEFVNEYGDLTAQGIHTVQIFYLERGAGASNLTLEFNLPIIPEGSVYVSKDVEYGDINYADLDATNNASADENLNLTVGNNTVTKFQKDDFKGKLYDFQIMYTTADTEPTWVLGGEGVITSALEYSLYETENPSNKTGMRFTSLDGKFSVPAGYTAIIKVPEAVGSEAELITYIEVREIGGSSSNKVYENLLGNYEYVNTYVQYKANAGEEFVTDSNIGSVNMSTVEKIALSKEYASLMYFNFVNNYKWNIDFDTKSDNKSVGMDIDENVKVIFHNRYDKENWSDGEGSAENTFDGTANIVENP